MILPFRRYAHWCLLKGFDDEALKKHWDELSLPDLPTLALADLRGESDNLPISPAYRRKLSKSQPWDASLSLYLARLGYQEIYDHQTKRPDLDHHTIGRWEKVWKLMMNPAMRVAIESAILAGVDLEELGGLASRPTGIQITPDMLELFKKYFFDTVSMTRPEWRDYLRLCAPHPYVYLRYQTALFRPKEEVLHLVGLPTKTQLGAFLNNVLSTANFKFQRYAALDNPDGDKQARAWAKIGIEAGIRAEKFAASDITDFAKAIQAEFEYVENPIDDIAGEMLAEIKPPAEMADEKPAALPPPQVDPENY